MSKLRGLEKDDADVRYSKTLSYLLRHGAEKQGLPMRQDGFVRVVDILDEPNLKALSFPHLHHLVETNNKKRFVLFYGYDPSPVRPERKKKQQGQTKKALKQQQEALNAAPSAGINAESVAELPLIPVDPPVIPAYDAEDVTQQTKPKTSPRSPTLGSNASEPEWFIRAAQGHSIQTVTTDLLEAITAADYEGLSKVGEMVHGTKAELWDAIREQGLSRGTRQHIHLAKARSGATRPRANSSLYIYLSLPNLLAQKPPIPVFLSSNSVVLSPGNAQGVIPKELFSKVIRLQREIVKPAPDESAGTNEQDTQGQERQAEGEAKPKRDRRNREKPRFVEEIIWEDGAAVDPPRLVVPDSL
ncbi:tRNA 2'-phosphotransferase [Naganishia albida]|nr:tRNA 2'-phosphotransferase [Naganishia albida]